MSVEEANTRSPHRRPALTDPNVILDAGGNTEAADGVDGIEGCVEEGALTELAPAELLMSAAPAKKRKGRTSSR